MLIKDGFTYRIFTMPHNADGLPQKTSAIILIQLVAKEMDELNLLSMYGLEIAITERNAGKALLCRHSAARPCLA